MCGIVGIASLEGAPVPELDRRIEVMNRLQAHRGPDGQGRWQNACRTVGLGHCRLAISDPENGSQPMSAPDGCRVVTNAEFYNHVEVRRLVSDYRFSSGSDTETFLAAYLRWGPDCLSRFRGMFSFALWDEPRKRLFCARDRFGIKPLYYTVIKNVFYCASEAKALLPFLPAIETDQAARQEYLTFQYCLGGKTLFRGIKELLPGHALMVDDGAVRTERYWDFPTPVDTDVAEPLEGLRARFEDAVEMELRADVPVGLFLSGGLDSSLIASAASRLTTSKLSAFHGRYSEGPEFDESRYAGQLAEEQGLDLETLTITVDDFITNLERIIYHLDFPTAGPGCIGQFMVAKLAARRHKAVLCGQGGDELFGGYARYRMVLGESFPGYDGTMLNGVEGLAKRYFSLINRSPKENPNGYSPLEAFLEHFPSTPSHPVEAMTRFELKESLRALLHVEDRVCMAHGLESRAPFLDRDFAEYVLSLPPSLKFHDPAKGVLKKSLGHLLPRSILAREDKMGFPIPLNRWLKGEALEYVQDRLCGERAKSRDNKEVLQRLDGETTYGRSFWGSLCLEIWQQLFHDQERHYRSMLEYQTV